MKISPARVASFDVLKRIETEGAYSSVLLPEYEAGLSPLDRGLCHELVLGVLRRQIWLDRCIDILAGGNRLDLAVRLALRLGLFQIRFLDRVPAHAAVSDSVSLVQRAKKTSAKGFVNAILRRALAEAIEVKPADEIDAVVLAASHPRWLIERWTDQFGQAAAAAIATANNSPARIAFRMIDAESDGAGTVSNCRPSAVVPGCFLSDQMSAELRDLHADGTIYFQDEASQMAARSVTVPQGGGFLDVCAAPGGKTGLIAAGMHGGLAVAGDIHRSRVEFLRSNLIRQRCGNVAVVQYDAEAPLPFADGSFDAVLVDAPCSGTGTIRRNPEIRYSLTPDDLTELPAKQMRILTNASKLVKAGGLLVYSTCSLEREENEAVAARFISTAPAFQTVTPNVPALFMISEAYARTWPQRDDMDGFFIAAFRRGA